MTLPQLLFFTIITLFSIAIFSILPVLSFLLFIYVRKKGKLQKYFSFTLFVFVTISMIFIAIKMITSPSGFGPERKTIEVKQNIGGKLICKSYYTADIRSYDYSISYDYIDSNGDTLDFKSGNYLGRSWDKEVQIRKYNNWLMLKTGDWIDNDKLILKNIQTDSTIIHSFTQKFVQQFEIWKSNVSEDEFNYSPVEIYIDEIRGNKVYVSYEFKTKPINFFFYSDKVIVFEIDNLTGDLKMISVE